VLEIFRDPEVKKIITNFNKLVSSIEDISNSLKVINKEIQKSNELKEKELEIHYEDLMRKDLHDENDFESDNSFEQKEDDIF